MRNLVRTIQEYGLLMLNQIGSKSFRNLLGSRRYCNLPTNKLRSFSLLTIKSII